MVVARVCRQPPLLLQPFLSSLMVLGPTPAPSPLLNLTSARISITRAPAAEGSESLAMLLLLLLLMLPVVTEAAGLLRRRLPRPLNASGRVAWAAERG